MPKALLAASLALLLTACAAQGPNVPMRTGATSPPPAALAPGGATVF
jgi:outer membrane biogenesis lipoprotein LolB